MEPMGGINKDVCGAKLLPKTVSVYVMNCICFCHLVNTQYRCLCPCRSIKPLPAMNPPPLPTPLSSCLPTPICAFIDIMVAVIKVPENPAVLANR